MGQRALAEILVQQMGLARVELAERGDDLVQFGLHVVSARHELPSPRIGA